VRKLQTGGASLLPVGMTGVEGIFRRGETLAIIGPDGREVAHGMSSYDSDALVRLCRVKSKQIAEILGYSYGDAVVHRNNLVLLV
jgi:glutamate 5-kinase